MDYANAFLAGTQRKAPQFADYSVLGKLQKQDESDRYGYGDGLATIAMSTLSGAGTGATIGGGVPGAIAGGIVGFGVGVWNAFKSDYEDEKRQEAAQEYNASAEAQRQAEIAIMKKQNEMVAATYNQQTRAENLNFYQKAVSAANEYS